MSPDERKFLIDSLLEGEISEVDLLRLEAELSVDAAARKEYYERIALSVLLDIEATSSNSEGPIADALEAGAPRPRNVASRIGPVSISGRRWRLAMLATVAIIAASVMLAVGLGPPWLGPLGPGVNGPGVNGPGRHEATGPAVPVESQASGFAVVSGQADAVWDGGQPLADGALVPEGPMRLTSGIVQLELFSGVVVVVEGDAAFSVLSPMEMALDRGKVRVHVPEPARGFRIRTREGEVVDLGTEFAMNVANGQSEVHVLDGEIEWRPHARDMRRMEKGQALRWSTDGQRAEFSAQDQDFVGAAEFRDQLESALIHKREAWEEFRETLRRDPRLVALYQTEAGDRFGRRLPNQALGRQATAGTGAVVAAARSMDRWGQPGGALDFSPTGSRVRLSIPGEYRSLTLLCWVKINSLDRWYNSLFLTDGHDLHEPHWQIMDTGRLFFSVKKRDDWDRSKGEKDKHIYLSPPFWDSSLSGQWLMIATVYDVDARRVSHYLNGKLLSEESIPEEYLVERVRIGSASLGNWGLPERDEPRFAVRNLNGSMDEFALFSAALSAEEIGELYEQGRP